MKLELPEKLTKPDEQGVTGLAQLYSDLGLQTDAAAEALKIALENIILLDKKQQDYGSKNISAYGAFGCVVRMSDKIAWLGNLYGKKRRKAVNENILDTFRDTSNYAIIAHLVETNKWPQD